MQNQSGGGGVPFQLIKTSEIPADWHLPPRRETLEHVARVYGESPENIEPIVVVELPDYSWAWNYARWSRTDENQLPDAVPVVVTSRDDFRGLASEQSRRGLAVETLRCLVETGKPLPLFMHVWQTKSGLPLPRS